MMIVIALGAILFIFSDDIFPPETPPVPPAVETEKPKPTEPAPAPAPEAPTTTPEPVAEAPTDTPVTTDPAVTDPTVTTPDTSTGQTETPAAPTEPMGETPADPTLDPTVTETPSSEPLDLGIEETPVTPTPDTSIPTTSEDTVDGQTTPTTVAEDNLTDKILEDLENQVKKTAPKDEKKEYVAPPDYEYKGRGLVYNCQGKHWACVDGPSFKSCEDNYSSSKYLKRKIECYPFNVYESGKGCESMQNRVVSSGAKTDFCFGN